MVEQVHVLNPFESVRTLAARITQEVSARVVGQEDAVNCLTAGLLLGGNVLMEGVPGLGKTLLVRALGQVLGCAFKRIQFTPDLMPADVTGGNVFNQKKDAFEFFPGPVFTQLLLADEINRAPAKTQSALLEAMQERSVTADGVTRPLPAPFLVIATQNPVESQGTYPLPEAQLDRFLFKIQIRHPSPAIEKTILKNHLAGFDAAALDRFGLARVVDAEEILLMQQALSAVRIDDGILDYITDVVGRTRAHRSIYLGDPDFVSMPIAHLVDKAYAAELAKGIDLAHATPSATLAAKPCSDTS